jgi:hypothetical protein
MYQSKTQAEYERLRVTPGGRGKGEENYKKQPKEL